jgi:hypothetical protein
MQREAGRTAILREPATPKPCDRDHKKFAKLAPGSGQRPLESAGELEFEPSRHGVQADSTILPAILRDGAGIGAGPNRIQIGISMRS